MPYFTILKFPCQLASRDLMEMEHRPPFKGDKDNVSGSLIISRTRFVVSGCSFAEFQKLCLNPSGMDQEIDISFSRVCHDMSGLVVDYRLGFHFIQDAFHVYLDISDELALERIGKANRIGDDAGTLANRNETFKQQFLQAYNLDYTQLTHYNLVVSITPEKTLQDIVDEVLQAIYK